MNETDAYVLDSIRKWVWSGYYSEAEIREEMLDDILEDDCDEPMLRAAVAGQWQAKQQAEQGWPAQTDCDRLDAVFYRLHEVGICALANAGYTMSDGHTEVTEAVAQAPGGHYHGYCFYHGQDVECAVDGGGLFIAFGDLQGGADADLAVGQQVAAALVGAGFVLAWDGTSKMRIAVPGFVWLRRFRE
ncbi:hypothetical protein QSH18_00900 [Xanthomonas sp. NCPPB 2654]|uniref:DUF6891 domain-containing protein n=1 Tax=unclassified Xanthomonas TaxID=2643310 RepID=UPI0021E066C7|nr:MULTISPECIES: hypothetical protein [unclassified Xanthomonas]MDL5364158.1 hypothetical protein [Xanthomonas sp. NCPPB 2654]UYC20852.1 hypothetical protein NUG20_00620 [Xanthomonas sp. CFBP 8443]